MPNWGSILGRFAGKAASSTVTQTIGYATGQAASIAIAPEVQPFANDLWSQFPTIPLSPQDAAEMVVQGILAEDAAAHEASQTGVNSDRFHNLVLLAGQPPGPETILSMLDRKIISLDRAKQGLLQSRLKPEWVDEFLRTNPALLTPGELAEMVVQGVMPEDAATVVAGYSSVQPDDFRRMVLLAGSPPGPQESLELWNRGVFTESDVDKALLQSRLKPEWIDQFKQLRETPLAASVAAELVLKKRIPYAQGAAIAAKQGVTEADFKLLADVNGRPIGTGQALQLARRGQFTKAAFDEVVARSDVRTEYTDDLWNLRRVLPRLGTITRLVTTGDLTETEATKDLMDLGYDKNIAAGLVAAAKKGKTQHTRDLAASQVDALYESGLEPEQWALDALQQLGYDAEEAGWHLMLLDARRLIAALNSNLNLVHRMFVSHKIDRATATNDLDAMQLDPDVRNQLLDTWENERAANVKRLTDAQIGSALKKGIIAKDEAIARWMGDGYAAADAEILAGLAGAGGHPASPTAP